MYIRDDNDLGLKLLQGGYGDLKKEYLRLWQKEALPKFLERLCQKKVEVTVAVQGSGKTLYSAACFAAALTQDRQLNELSLDEIHDKVSQSNGRFLNFAVIFIPNTSIVDTTIRDWEKLGLCIERLHNPDLLKNNIPDLISNGVVRSQIICRSSQINVVLRKLMSLINILLIK